MSSAAAITPRQREKEKAVVKAIVLDSVLMVILTTVGLLSGSMTALSEIVRFALLLVIEYVAYIVLRRAHRNRFSEFEFGTGKIERITNLLVAFGLVLSCIYILSRIFSIGDEAPIAMNMLMLTMVGANANLLINIYCTVIFIRSNREESSVIVSSQIAARIAKTVASIVAFGVFVIALWLPDPKSARIVDLIGSVIMVGYMFHIAYGLIRESLPEILDRSIPEPEHYQILRILTEHFDNYDGFEGYKARRSGKDLFILLRLHFFPEQTLQQVEDRLVPLRQAIEKELPGSTITIDPAVMKHG